MSTQLKEIDALKETMKDQIIIPMNGKTFNECWAIDDLTIKDKDHVVVEFSHISDTIIKITVNNNEVWNNTTD